MSKLYTALMLAATTLMVTACGISGTYGFTGAIKL